ncbi:hypothetical protein pEaSNUABM28_00133 [Erwinia phage pEa_SNUABM_28]|uniref:LysM domain-containing protein n=2 Tax=Alexandravirus TaxID=2733088 RepID=A0AAE9BVB6_9CAUD|nr:tail sheath [Erwinia phage pEa_SNUABM_22]YP_010299892.1 tail sheath [Erwinia phage pEa_SNUABM_16]QZE58690.1 hypothetical protein pEaSNUABM28_00133 [Erwinia phage pEa_SNUABM_28]QZE59034.1 hypothetical protein pEaSNUABM18_00131 [Erwinia phage pEa_SNUABM_18]UAW96275.1 hypothetical protein pEaSNUABM16_00131 [Erwinia phage pEa_SNUABM_16]UAW96618.1 hypothetical protein pEaSNUABM22_00131 [Erwinia phage pEa_SNUABM_22]
MAETIGVIDKWGIDPLTMKIFDDVDAAQTGTSERIDAALEGNPQLLSVNKYGSNGYWNFILIANALLHPSELKAGMLVVFPQKRPSAAIKKVKRTQI